MSHKVSVEGTPIMQLLTCVKSLKTTDYRVLDTVDKLIKDYRKIDTLTHEERVETMAELRRGIATLHDGMDELDAQYVRVLEQFGVQESEVPE